VRAVKFAVNLKSELLTPKVDGVYRKRCGGVSDAIAEATPLNRERDESYDKPELLGDAYADVLATEAVEDR
jgi:hypothetical protein